MIVKTNLPFALEVFSGSRYTGAAYEHQVDRTLIGSHCEPALVATWQRDGAKHAAWLIDQGAEPIVVVITDALPTPNTNQTEWLSVHWEAFQLSGVPKEALTVNMDRLAD